jgi:hypothetical protein
VLLDGGDEPVLAGQPTDGGQQHVAQYGTAAGLQNEVKAVMGKFDGGEGLLVDDDSCRSPTSEEVCKVVGLCRDNPAFWSAPPLPCRRVNPSESRP